MTRRIDVRIDRLTVDAGAGFDARAVAAAVERALGERLKTGAATGLRPASLDRVQTAPAADAASAGAAIARAILGGGTR